MKKICRICMAYVLTVAVLVSSCAVAFASTGTPVNVTGVGYSVAIPEFDGGILVEAELKKTGSATVGDTIAVVGDDGTEFVNVDVSSYINSDDFTLVKLLYFKYTGKYAVYTGTENTYKMEGNDKLSRTWSGDRITQHNGYEKMLSRVVFSGEMQLKGFKCSEAMKVYENYTLDVIDADYTKASEKNVGDTVYGYAGATTKDSSMVENKGSGENTGWNYYTSKGTNYYYKNVFVNDPAKDSERLVMEMREKTSGCDQRVCYTTGSATNSNGNTVVDVTKGRPIKIQAGIFVPSNNNGKAVSVELDLKDLSGYACMVAKVLLPNGTNKTFKLQGYNDEHKMVDVANGIPCDKWVDFTIYIDIDAQRCMAEYTVDGVTNTSEIWSLYNKSIIGTYRSTELQLMVIDTNENIPIYFDKVNVQATYVKYETLDIAKSLYTVELDELMPFEISAVGGVDGEGKLVANGSVDSVTLKRNGTESGCTVLSALYLNGVLQDAKVNVVGETVAQHEKGSVSLTNALSIPSDVSGYTVGVYVWNGVSAQIPLAEAFRTK